MSNRQISGATGKIHRTTVRVRFGDTDPYGIVYFVTYFRWCHRAIEEFLRAVGLKPAYKRIIFVLYSRKWGFHLRFLKGSHEFE